MVLTGAGWWVAHGALGGITVSQALRSDDPRSSGGSMNILLIGLDSRKDQNGNDLPWAILKHLHAGDSDAGGYNTNTLILVHVGADDRVVAFSIPRDDWVPFRGVPGYHHIKIKEAYGLTKQYVEQKLIDKGVSDQKELETKGREAGRAATLRAVRNLTGFRSTTSPRSTWPASTTSPRAWAACRSASSTPSTTSIPARTSRRAGRLSTPSRHCRSSGSVTGWRTATSTAPIASRHSCPRLCANCRIRAPSQISASSRA
ncbi:cell envelope-related transcriptional attenuator domain protein [Mycobacterium xenopi 3993]|nr:cell envelope-related transcriptional attenuator domain protein [Mycobacterium xenopi 3993]